MGDLIGLTIPADAFWAKDYHLDWIVASLNLSFELHKEIYEQSDKNVNENQENIDLLVAVKSENTVHLILLEARGVIPWNNKQLIRKAESLKNIFGKNGYKWNSVKPQFIMISLRESQRIETDSWLDWMRNNNKCLWMKLSSLPSNLVKIVRCTQEGKVDKKRMKKYND